MSSFDIVLGPAGRILSAKLMDLVHFLTPFPTILNFQKIAC